MAAKRKKSTTWTDSKGVLHLTKAEKRRRSRTGIAKAARKQRK